MRVAGDVGEDEEPQRRQGRLRGAHEGDHEHIGGALDLRGHEYGRRHEKHDGAPHDAEGYALENLGAADPKHDDETDDEKGNREVGQGKHAVGVGKQKRPGNANGEAVDRDSHGDAPKGQRGLGVLTKGFGGHGFGCGLGVKMLVAAVQRGGNGEAHQREHDAGARVAHDKHEAFDQGGDHERKRRHAARLVGLHLAIGCAPGSIGVGNAVPTHDADGQRVHGNAQKPRHFQVKHHEGRQRQADCACHGGR